jgi:hypothetical protein
MSRNPPRGALLNPTLASPRPARTRAAGGMVAVRQEDLVIPTYLPAAPDRNPMFLEKRVYQGSSGRVYPLPFTDRISETKTDRKWRVSGSKMNSFA